MGLLDLRLAQWVADAGAHDGGLALLGIDLRERLWRRILKGIEWPVFVDAYLQLDRDQSVARLRGDEFVLEARGTGASGKTTLAGGASCTVDVTFKPTTAGSKAASLSVNASPGGPATATLSGTGAGIAQMALGFRHTCARKTDGTVWCWGPNNYAQLGNGSHGTSNPSPGQVVGLCPGPGDGG